MFVKSLRVPGGYEVIQISMYSKLQSPHEHLSPLSRVCPGPGCLYCMYTGVAVPVRLVLQEQKRGGIAEEGRHSHPPR